MMLPGLVTMIPVFLIWKEIGLNNTQVPLWAGNLFGSAFYIFLLRQFFLGLPGNCSKRPESMAAPTSDCSGASRYHCPSRP